MPSADHCWTLLYAQGMRMLAGQDGECSTSVHSSPVRAVSAPADGLHHGVSVLGYAQVPHLQGILLCHTSCHMLSVRCQMEEGIWWVTATCCQLWMGPLVACTGLILLQRMMQAYRSVGFGVTDTSSPSCSQTRWRLAAAVHNVHTLCS